MALALGLQQEEPIPECGLVAAPASIHATFIPSSDEVQIGVWTRMSEYPSGNILSVFLILSH